MFSYTFFFFFFLISLPACLPVLVPLMPQNSSDVSGHGQGTAEGTLWYLAQLDRRHWQRILGSYMVPSYPVM